MKGLKRINSCFLIFMTLLLLSCQESREERYARETREYTERNCPQTITKDGIIVLDSLVYTKPSKHPEGLVTYFYSVNADSTAISFIKEDRKRLYDSLLESVKANVDLKKMKDDGITIRHIYRKGDSHQLVLEFLFTEKDYQ